MNRTIIWKSEGLRPKNKSTQWRPDTLSGRHLHKKIFSKNLRPNNINYELKTGGKAKKRSKNWGFNRLEYMGFLPFLEI